MDQATEVLVIINSIVLIIFLIMSMVALTYIIRVMKRVDRMSEKAESAVDSLEAAAQAIKEASTPIGFGRALGSMINSFAQRSSGGESSNNLRSNRRR